MLVDLAILPVLPQQPPQDSHPSEPHHLGWHTRLGGTLAFTVTGVSAETFGGKSVASTGAGVDHRGFDDAMGIEWGW